MKLLLFVTCMMPCAAAAATDSVAPPVGSLQGRVEDGASGSPLAEADLEVAGTELRARTDAHGAFALDGVPVGRHEISVSRLAYVPQVLTDVVVGSDRSTVLKVRLRAQPRFEEELKVEPDFFPADGADRGASAVSFSHEEIRRAAGTGGDITKYLSSLPSAARVNTLMNHLAVRGGSPIENLSYIDGIEVPNINHYPIQGSASGFSPIGLVNLAFVDDVTFRAGGFAAEHGGALSSVVDIRFREGSPDRTQFQADMGVAGFGLAGEGPIGRDRGSWLLSVRRSYLDGIMKLLDYDAVPRYGDLQGKLGLRLSDRHRLSVLAIAGDDHFGLGPDASVAGSYFGSFDTRELTAGLSWRALWTADAFTDTSVSYSRTS
jgi:hypothetical protein